MPNSAVLLDIKSKGVSAEIQLPLSELELAFGNHLIDANSTSLVQRLGPQLKAYLLKHIHPVSTGKQPWTVTINDMMVQPVAQSPSGPYRELTVHLWLQPPPGESSRAFTLNYDVIVHQVVTHVALVSIRQDWDAGLYAGHPVQVGVIRLDPVNNVIPPLVVNQAEGSIWTGFKSMVGLGMQHISEGTDHLLFLLVLLLPAPLLVVNIKWEVFAGRPLPANKNRWGSYGGLTYSLGHILKVVTAFTIGHSVTLLAGVMGWVHAPGQAIEVLIAVSILVSAVHALRPIFPNQEMYIAGGFGLIHGLAFASTLANLNLETSRMVLSILGFNIGIELMQLFVIALVIPWLILLSRLPVYRFVRISGAVFASIAATAWIMERASGQSNFISTAMVSITAYAPYLILMLVLLTGISYLLDLKPDKKDPIKTVSRWPPIL
ncbi:MAG: HupE/UreJ family protein [Sphingobacteriaceae bacterium]|nr:MAG: HupE/UreJ family protein [Sphingobacteriaceae bacterium]